MSMIRLKRKRRCNMCCLFGVLDFQQTLTRRQRQRLSTALSIAAQTRGTDATGLAYISGNRLQICKAPRPARAVHFRIPDDARAIMGHTRMTTQGSASHNCNNHPFPVKLATPALPWLTMAFCTTTGICVTPWACRPPGSRRTAM